MALTFRVASRASLAHRLLVARAGALRCATTAQDEMKSYWEKNDKLGRPMSPYLSSYNLGITGNLSLCHRITGSMMYTGLTAFGAGMLMLPGQFPEYLAMIKDLHMGSAVIFLTKAFCAFPLVWHYTNGIRHLSWDAGKGFDMKQVLTSAYSVMALSAVITIALASL